MYLYVLAYIINYIINILLLFNMIYILNFSIEVNVTTAFTWWVDYKSGTFFVVLMNFIYFGQFVFTWLSRLELK